jgi:hypothetical protein
MILFDDKSMTIAVSIAVGVALGCLMYWLLFHDVGDFIDGAFGVLFRPKPVREEDFEDGCPAGLRFFFFLVVSVGGAYLVFHLLEKHFG